MTKLAEMKIKKIRSYMRQAENLATNSHDAETQVGCIIIDIHSYEQFASGYNGFVRGVRDDVLPKIRPDKHVYVEHAEENAITNAARHRGGLEGKVAIVTLSPCASCMRKLVNAGISCVIFKEKYRTYDDVCKMLDIEITEKRLEEFYVIYYKPREYYTVSEDIDENQACTRMNGSIVLKSKLYGHQSGVHWDSKDFISTEKLFKGEFMYYIDNKPHKLSPNSTHV